MAAVRLSALLLFAALGLTLSACSAPDLGAHGAANTNAGEELPEFSGPYAAEFAENYANSTDDFVRKILKDGQVSEQENSEVLDRFSDCVSAKGYTVASYALNGSYKIEFDEGTDSEKAGEDVDKCSLSSGEADVSSLYSWTHRNPERIDENTLVAACLVKAGLVSPAYTSRNYEKDTESDRFNFDADGDGTGREKLELCRIDPLGVTQ